MGCRGGRKSMTRDGRRDGWAISSTERVFSRELSGWYLLAGVSRGYTTTVPGESCGNLAVIEAEVKTDKLPLRGRMAVDRSMCGP